MQHYMQLVRLYPFTSAFIQFAFLGTLGEILSGFIVSKKFKLSCTAWELSLKVVAWGVLGLFVKVGFSGMKGFVTALLETGILPGVFKSGIGWAFALSVLTNTFFGPQLVVFHRMEDNLILRQTNLAGLGIAFKALLWFWIPAHTVTFSQPAPLQVGLAAVWSFALGLILGYAKNRA